MESIKYGYPKIYTVTLRQVFEKKISYRKQIVRQHSHSNM